MRRAGRVGTVVIAALCLSLGAFGCSDDGDAGDEPTDPVLAQGRDVYRQHCAQCHGSRGGGGAGVRLADVVAARYPDIQDHIAVIRDGREGMPAFGERLSPEEIEAVARWEREGF